MSTMHSALHRNYPAFRYPETHTNQARPVAPSVSGARAGLYPRTLRGIEAVQVLRMKAHHGISAEVSAHSHITGNVKPATDRRAGASSVASDSYRTESGK